MFILEEFHPAVALCIIPQLKSRYSTKMAASLQTSDSLWLGIDLGTTSVKVVLLDQYGNVRASQFRSADAQVKSDIGDQGYEQDPKKIFQTVHDLVLPLTSEQKHRIKGIGITGQMHGVVLWRLKEKGGDVTESIAEVCDGHCSNLITWQDQRCTPEFLESLPSPSSKYQPLSTGHGCATLFWLMRNRPSFLKNSNYTCCGTIMDYLVTVLCGQVHPVTSDQLAASLGYFNTSTLTWDSVLYDGGEFPHQLLPKIVPAGSQTGQVRPSLKGWPENVPVYVGMGDVQCAMYAILKKPSDAAVNISTSIQLGFIVPAKDTERVCQASPPSLSFFPYFDGCHLALCAGLNGGNAIHHFVDCLSHWIQDLGFSEIVDVNSLMLKLQELAEDVKDEEEGKSLTIKPTFFGERHDTTLQGHISGMNVHNFSKIGVVFQSVCQGVVDHMFSMVSADYLLSCGITQLLMSGSVPVKNSIVQRRLLQLYNVGDLKTVMDSEGADAAGSAVGAAKVVKDLAQKET